MQVVPIKEGGMGAEGFVSYPDGLQPAQVKTLLKQVELAIHDYNEIPPRTRNNLSLDKAEFITYYLHKAGFRDAKYEYFG